MICNGVVNIVVRKTIVQLLSFGNQHGNTCMYSKSCSNDYRYRIFIRLTICIEYSPKLIKLHRFNIIVALHILEFMIVFFFFNI